MRMLFCAWLWVLAACGSAERGSPVAAPRSERSQPLDSLNGLSFNGLSANGLSANGLSANGLSANGLSTNGLATGEFEQWFAQDPAVADMVMRYVVRCAVPSGQTRAYADPRTGQRYTWSGQLGLAPDWAGGAPANETEQRVITACLLAHLNRYGQSIPISVLGRSARGEAIPYSAEELLTYSVREACFFGNLFTQEGLYFGVDRFIDDEAAYLTRACAGLGSEAAGTGCAPLQFIGGCFHSCAPDVLGGPFYASCTHDGVTYPAITTRMKQSDYEQLFTDSSP